ncbi:MAG TPA: T9SS type A sorting domain-containing protein, partial [Mangrovimonas sp.]|nr:T9SS type A sorting domain-containing protein [Mangrovimonas sp.]
NEFLGFSLFPNPNNGEFTIKFKTISGQDQIGVQVSDIRGRTVFNNMYATNGTEFNQTINLGQLQSGMYLVNVNDGQRKITKKIVVE